MLRSETMSQKDLIEELRRYLAQRDTEFEAFATTKGGLESQITEFSKTLMERTLTVEELQRLNRDLSLAVDSHFSVANSRRYLS